MHKRNSPIQKETFPAGTYYVGDPCYPFPNDGPLEPLWDDICKSIDKGNLFFDFMGHRVAMDSTAHGDGSYHGSDGKKYAVDAGMLGILPVALVDYLGEDKEWLNKLSSIVTFDKPFTVAFDNGLFGFGHIHIETNDEEEEVGDDNWGYEEEDEE